MSRLLKAFAVRHGQLEHLEPGWSQADIASCNFPFFSPTSALVLFFFLVYCTLLMMLLVINQTFGTKILTHRFNCFCEMQSQVRDFYRGRDKNAVNAWDRWICGRNRKGNLKSFIILNCLVCYARCIRKNVCKRRQLLSIELDYTYSV